MEVTGYQLKEALKMASLELETIRSQFDETLYAFEDEKKKSPYEVSEQISELEAKIANIQAAQEYYNQNVMVDVLGERISLAVAIKLVGGAGRLAKMWKTAARGTMRDRWAYRNDMTRNKDQEVAKSTIEKDEALKTAKNAEKKAAALRSAIAYGNTQTVPIGWVDENLLS